MVNFATFKGKITELKCKADVTKITIETVTEKTKLDEIKLLIDSLLNVSISNNQTTLPGKYQINELEQDHIISPEGAKLLKEAKEVLEQ